MAIQTYTLTVVDVDLPNDFCRVLVNGRFGLPVKISEFRRLARGSQHDMEHVIRLAAIHIGKLGLADGTLAQIKTAIEAATLEG